MKRLRLMAAFALAVLLLLFPAACGTPKLDAPVLLGAENDVLTWERVEGARSYTVRIVDAATGDVILPMPTIRSTSYSLRNLDEGDYFISVMASGGGKSTAVSDWSDELGFKKKKDFGLLYESTGTEYHIVGVTSASGEIKLDAEFLELDKPVTAIGERAFRANGSITGVTVGKSVRSIGASAFYNCRTLATLVFEPGSELTSLGGMAFQGCNGLKSVALPDSLTEIPELAFGYCRGLESVTLGSAVRTVGSSAFYACSALKEIDLPDSVSVIGEDAFSTDDELKSVTFGTGLELIGEDAFNGCEKLSEVSFRESAEEGVQLPDLTIDVNAFYGCSALTEITLPERVVSIGNYAFATSGLGKDKEADPASSVRLPSTLRDVGIGAFNASSLYDKQKEEGFIYAGNWLVAITPDLRNELTRVSPDTIKEGTVGIAGGVFMNAQALESVVLPVSVKYTCYGTFYNCPALFQFTSANRDGLETVGYMAFANCGALSQLQLREGLKDIGSYAFYGCTNVYNVTSGYSLVPSTVEHIGSAAFTGTGIQADEYGLLYAANWVVGFDESAITSDVTLKEGTVGVADYALWQADNVTNLIGMGSVLHIGEAAFGLCSALSSVQFNTNITEIPNFAFYKCSALYQVELPRMLTRIGNYAFYVCDRLRAVDFSRCSRLESVGSHAFFECTNISQITFNEGLEEIGDYAFYHCSRIQELSVPGSVTKIGDRAFGQCVNLVNLELNEAPEGSEIEMEIGALAFRNCGMLWCVALPQKVKTVGDYAFYNCKSLRSLDLGNVEEIGKYAFFGCGFTSLYLPESVVSVGDGAFAYCTQLASITLHASVSHFGVYPFYTVYPQDRNVLGGITVYVIGETEEGWDRSWNIQLRPLVQGCVLSADGGYVESVTVGENTLTNGVVWGGLKAPARRGYAFVGWSETPGSETAEHPLNYLLEAPAGTTLYAVWEESPEEPAPELGELQPGSGEHLGNPMGW